MSEPKIGKKAPAFNLPASSGLKIASKNLRGKKVILYFYPKDATPGCTTEAKDFRDHFSAFSDLNVVILGVSRDSVKSHDRFKEKQELPFELLSDEDEVICSKYDVIKEKNLYGKKHMGVERSTFLIDEEGVLREVWRKVRVKGHVETVLAAVKALEE